MRARFNLNRLCSSDNYSASRRIHMDDLRKNHEKNKTLFLSIPVRKKTSLELFEEGVRRSIESFRKAQVVC